MVIIKPADIIRFAIDGVTDPIVAFAQRRFGWNRFELIARIEFVRTPVDFVFWTWFIERMACTDWHEPPMPVWIAVSLMVINVIWSALRLRAGWEMRQAGMGRLDRVGRSSTLVSRARELGVRHWYWALVWTAVSWALLVLSLLLLTEGFLLSSAQVLGLSTWIAATLLSHALWNHSDVAAILPALPTDD